MPLDEVRWEYVNTYVHDSPSLVCIGPASSIPIRDGKFPERTVWSLLYPFPSYCSYNMPPKRHAFDVRESNAARWQRLCPDRAPPASLNIHVGTSTSAVQMQAPQRGSKRSVSTSSSAAAMYVTPPPGRADAPVVRHTRRGTTAAAVAALATFGSIALVEALLQDRHARSASSTMATLASTWQCGGTP